MAVHVDGGGSLMLSDKSAHQARLAGDDVWTVSFLPGRMLSADQAVAALRAAEELVAIGEYGLELGLTALELVGLAAFECTWPTPALSRGPGIRARLGRIGSR
ncbi:hypothetical protein ACQPW1_02225 [Nocardia sp. CA-128927]|uniref:hypothetical protein n=1 Tax=Nocardia sp. CA-128927 TaxID=3239975 RepID=UPI003D96657E